MPYIQKEKRVKYEDIAFPPIPDKGELEYVVYRIMQHYMSDKEFRYATLHDCVYAVIHCAHEFERRNLDKREDKAMEENGDI